MRIHILLFAFVASWPIQRGQAVDLETATGEAKQIVKALNEEDYPAVQRHFSKEMDRALPLDKSSAFFKRLRREQGKIEDLGEGRLMPPAIVFPVKFERGALNLKLVFDASGSISGLWFLPHTSSKPAPKRNHTTLALPFNGRWLVFWGGDTHEQNYHRDTPNQRFAFDLLGVGPEGKTRRGKGKGNEDYYAYGREVLAPGDGKVITVIDGVPDNEPGSMNPYSTVGNCVMIQHREDEVSVLAHFQPGSIRVKPGQQVRRGQVLGLCGNSGNSSEPHIHYHLQHSAVLQDGLGVKCFFEKVIVTRDGKEEKKTDYSPVKGEIVHREQ